MPNLVGAENAIKPLTFMNKLVSFITLWMLGICSVVAQGVRGAVWDNIEPLPGAVVLVEGTGRGTTTDLNGNFVLPLSQAGEYRLIISYLGYISDTVTVRFEGQWIDLGRLILRDNSVEIAAIEVTGRFREGDAKAVNLTKLSPSLITITSYETIQKLPDRNVADAVQRLSSVSIQRDQGEGRFVSVRGTPKDWNAMLINGDRLPAADEEGNTRAVALDFFPSELLQYIQLSKALTPDIEADAIGASVNFMTKVIPEQREFSIRAGVGYNAKAFKPMANVALSYGGRSKSEKWGFLLNGSYFNRFWATDNYQVAFASNFNQSVNRLELRDYEGVRNTYGGHMHFDRRFNSHYSMFARGYAGMLRDNEWNRKVMYRYATGTGSTVELQNIHNLMITRFLGGDLGGKFSKGAVQLNWRAASYSNQFTYGDIPFKNDDGQLNGYFVTRFQKANVAYLDQVFVEENGALDLFKLLGKDQVGSFPLDTLETSVGLFLVPDTTQTKGEGDGPRNIRPILGRPVSVGDFEFIEAYSEYRKHTERDPFVFQMDVQWQPSEKWVIKGGLKQRLKDGNRLYNITSWRQDINDPTSSESILMTSFPLVGINPRNNFLKEIGSPYNDMLYPFLELDALDNIINDLGDRLVIQADSTLPLEEATNRQSNNYSYRENVAAAFGMFAFEPNRQWLITGGLRLEHTYLSIDATDTRVVFDPNTGFLRYQITDVSASRQYLSFFPSLHFRYSPKKDINLRWSGYRSMRRPNFNEVKPGAPLIDVTNFTREFGNPLLNPSFAWNLDWAFEWFFASKGYLSAGVFYKNISDNIFATSQGDTDNRFGYVNRSYTNAESAWIAGVELILNRQFDFLPGFLSGVGIHSNYTYAYSVMETPGRTITQNLPEQAPHILNVSLYYETPKVNTRLGLNWKSAFLYEINTFPKEPGNQNNNEYLHNNTNFDIFAREMIALDYAFTYRWKNKFMLTLEVNNLLNSPLLIYRGERFRPVKTEYYGFRTMLNFKYNL